MTIFEAILLGLVQGLFMFVPVSSTSHLVLVQHWLIERGSAMPAPESPEMILFDLIVHVGTLVSIAVVFRRSLRRFLDDLLRDGRAWIAGARGRGSTRSVEVPEGAEDSGQSVEGSFSLRKALHLRLALLGLVSVFVTGAVGLTFKPIFEQVFAHPLAIAGTLTITGVLLYFTDKVGPRWRGLRQLTLTVAIVIGLAQAFALVPGLSRSGLTIAFAIFLGLKRRWAAEYSFFIAIPTILAATGVQTLQILRAGEPIDMTFLPLAAGFVVAAIVGIGALYLVLTLLYRARFRYFAYYVWALAILVAIGVITPT